MALLGVCSCKLMGSDVILYQEQQQKAEQQWFLCFSSSLSNISEYSKLFYCTTVKIIILWNMNTGHLLLMGWCSLSLSFFQELFLCNSVSISVFSPWQTYLKQWVLLLSQQKAWGNLVYVGRVSPASFPSSLSIPCRMLFFLLFSG